MSIFGLVSSYAAVFVILNGLDVTRSFQSQIKSKRSFSEVEPVIGTLFCFLLIANSVFLLFSFLLNNFFPFHFSVLALFVIFVIFEHFSQEAGRILVVMNLHFYNSAGILLRSFIPALVFLLFFALEFEVDVIIAISTLIFFSFLSAIYSWGMLIKKVGFRIICDFRQIYLILSSIKASLFFFVATLIGKALFALDKTFIEAKFGSQFLASYILILGVSMVVVPLVEIFFGSYALPRFYELSKFRDGNFRSEFQRFFLKTVLFSTLYVIFAVLVSHYMLFSFFSDYKKVELLDIVLISLIPYVFALSVIPTYCLISGDKSLSILISALSSFAVISFVVFFVESTFTSFLVYFLLCFLIMLFVRFYFANSYVRSV